MDLGALGGAATAFQVFRELLDSLVAARDFSKVADITMELKGRVMAVQDAYMSIQERNAALVQRNHEIEAQIQALKVELAEKGQYELHQLASMAFAYTHKPQVGSTTPTHYLCQPCRDKGHKAVLQPLQDMTGGWNLQCTLCQTVIDAEASDIAP